MALVGVRSELPGVRHAVCSTCTMTVCSYTLCDGHFTGMNDFEVSDNSIWITVTLPESIK